MVWFVAAGIVFIVGWVIWVIVVSFDPPPPN